MSGDAKVSFTGSRSTFSRHWFEPGGNRCGNAMSIEAMLSAQSRLTASLMFCSEIISWILSILFMIESIRSLRAAITSLALAASCALDPGGRASDIATQPTASPAHAARLRRDSVGRRAVTLHLRAAVCAESSFAGFLLQVCCCRSVVAGLLLQVCCCRSLAEAIMLQSTRDRSSEAIDHGSLGGRWLPGPAPTRMHALTA